METTKSKIEAILELMVSENERNKEGLEGWHYLNIMKTLNLNNKTIDRLICQFIISRVELVEAQYDSEKAIHIVRTPLLLELDDGEQGFNNYREAVDKRIKQL